MSGLRLPPRRLWRTVALAIGWSCSSKALACRLVTMKRELVPWLLYPKRVMTRLPCVEGTAKQGIQAGASFHCVGVFWKLSSA